MPGKGPPCDLPSVLHNAAAIEAVWFHHNNYFQALSYHDISIHTRGEDTQNRGNDHTGDDAYTTARQTSTPKHAHSISGRCVVLSLAEGNTRGNLHSSLNLSHTCCSLCHSVCPANLSVAPKDPNSVQHKAPNRHTQPPHSSATLNCHAQLLYSADIMGVSHSSVMYVIYSLPNSQCLLSRHTYLPPCTVEQHFTVAVAPLAQCHNHYDIMTSD